MRISDWSSDVCSSDLTCSESGTFRADSLTDRADTDDEHHARTQQARHPRPPTACLLIPKSFRQPRSEEHTSELQSLMRISYAVFCLKTKKEHTQTSHLNVLLHHTILTTNAHTY